MSTNFVFSAAAQTTSVVRREDTGAVTATETEEETVMTVTGMTAEMIATGTRGPVAVDPALRRPVGRTVIVRVPRPRAGTTMTRRARVTMLLTRSARGGAMIVRVATKTGRAGLTAMRDGLVEHGHRPALEGVLATKWTSFGDVKKNGLPI